MCRSDILLRQATEATPVYSLDPEQQTHAQGLADAIEPTARTPAVTADATVFVATEFALRDAERDRAAQVPLGSWDLPDPPETIPAPLRAATLRPRRPIL